MREVVGVRRRDRSRDGPENVDQRDKRRLKPADDLRCLVRHRRDAGVERFLARPRSETRPNNAQGNHWPGKGFQSRPTARSTGHGGEAVIER
ncbi:hypothetical protein [Amycolatopsis sp. GA6-003]|uniref:hypothetical protein n=1 Tax=Amycolatopsis sp. GA6-003 TaxID=2652444 RepID=UPI0039175A58